MLTQVSISGGRATDPEPAPDPGEPGGGGDLPQDGGDPPLRASTLPGTCAARSTDRLL